MSSKSSNTPSDRAPSFRVLVVWNVRCNGEFRQRWALAEVPPPTVIWISSQYIAKTGFAIVAYGI